ncbi:hypothetical protein EJ03DRAFT_346752 [Teratosphaeria nubilosa]|uniref:Uncharacterized protein n=1 Tax=Teratosphaeria nubilosa TaxID=161662 RepID=A0A6G1LML9_9PEZI|nr:hypothetical protein EJ03DRAFT_346752 [Teratosphaeria nubilosa]
MERFEALKSWKSEPRTTMNRNKNKFDDFNQGNLPTRTKRQDHSHLQHTIIGGGRRFPTIIEVGFISLADTGQVVGTYRVVCIPIQANPTAPVQLHYRIYGVPNHTDTSAAACNPPITARTLWRQCQKPRNTTLTVDFASDRAFEKAMMEGSEEGKNKDETRGVTAKKFVRHFLEAGPNQEDDDAEEDEECAEENGHKGKAKRTEREVIASISIISAQHSDPRVI